MSSDPSDHNDPSCNEKRGGYKNPPKDKRFPEGRSGNYNGRPPKSKNTGTLVNDALNERVMVTEKGRRRSRSMREVIINRLVTKSANADLKAIAMILELIERIESSPAPSPRTHTIDDEAVLRGLRERFGKEGDDDAHS